MDRPEEREKGTMSLFKRKIHRNFLYLWEELDIQSKKLTDLLIFSNQKGLLECMLKLTKIVKKETKLKVARVKTVTYEINPIRLSIIQFFSKNSISLERVVSTIQNI